VSPALALHLGLALLASPTIPRIITVEDLAARLKDPKLVVFQIGDDHSKPVYDAGHIPGSQFLNPFTVLAAPRGGEGALYLELPSADSIQAALEARGVSDDSYVVLVPAAEYFSPTSRAVLTLEYAGMAGRVAVLDGGLEAWQKAGNPVSTDIPTPARGHFTPRLDPNVVVTADYVAKNLDNPKVAILDARDTAFYNGRDTHQGRNGHIKGAHSVPFTTMMTADGRFKDLATLGEIFKEAGALPGTKVVTYCHIGQQATLVWFVARVLGYDASLYDGSFQDWARHPDLPVEGGRP